MIFAAPRSLILLLPTLLLAISVHEFAHALTAYLLGDQQQRHSGRLSLNPFKHFEFVGFLALLLLGFGWGRPVLSDARAFRYPRCADTLIALAGPASNLLLAFLALLVGQQLRLPWRWWAELLGYTVLINTSLAVFNLLPIPPLDGSHVLMNLLPSRARAIYLSLGRLGLLLLLGLLLFDRFFDLDLLPLSRLIFGVVRLLQRAAQGLSF